MHGDFRLAAVFVDDIQSAGDIDGLGGNLAVVAKRGRLCSGRVASVRTFLRLVAGGGSQRVDLPLMVTGVGFGALCQRQHGGIGGRDIEDDVLKVLGQTGSV